MIRPFFDSAGWAAGLCSISRKSLTWGKGQTMSYEAPRLTVHGSIESLTQLSPPSPVDGGSDPCRFNKPRDLKQSGTSDFILGQASLSTCTASSA